MAVLKKAISFLFNSLKRLNLFNTYGTDEEQIRHEILTTRIYLILLPLILTILIVYSARKETFHTVTINNPTIEHYHRLLNIYPDTLSCPCSQFLIPYSNFISIIPQYHPICSSDFVSDQWLDYLYKDDASFYLAVDLRSVGSAHFQLLRTLCQSSQKAIENAFQSTFTTATLVNARRALLPSELIRIEIETFANNFINDIVSEQRHRRTLFTTYTDQNFLVTALETSVIPVFDTSSILKMKTAEYYSSFFDTPSSFAVVQGVVTCYCEMNYECYSPVGVCNNSLYETDYSRLKLTYSKTGICPTVIKGFKSGCMPFKSLLGSTLECYYDQPCFNGILGSLSTINSSFNILQIDDLSKSNPQTTIGTLVDNLMVEQWSTQMNYSLYFTKCNPLSCSYSYTERMNILYIVTNLLGLFGGLTAALRLLCPQLTNIFYQIKKFILNKKTNNTNKVPASNQKFNLFVMILNLFSKLRQTLFNLNLFARRNSKAEDIRKQVIATRLYIGSSIVLLAIFVSVTLFDQRMITTIVKMPNVTEFEDLYQSGKINHSCPCSQIAIKRSKFISLSPNYHPVCSSPFISYSWLSSIKFSIYKRTYYYLDIRSYALDMFSLMQSFCSLTNVTISNATVSFLFTDWVSTHVLSREQFDQQVQIMIKDFQSNILSTYKQVHDLAYRTNQGNQLFSSRFSNFFFDGLFDNSSHLVNIQTYIGILSSMNNTFSSYHCILSGCHLSLGIYELNDDEKTFTLVNEVPGFRVARYPLDSLRTSTLECLFNQSCFDMIVSHFERATMIPDFRPLNSSILINYSPNTTIGDIFDNLMIEQWTETIDYQTYYNICKPLTCSYTSYKRFDWLYTLTILTSIFGGLTVSLRIICPLLAKLYFKCCRRQTGSASTIHEDQSTTGQASSISRIIHKLRQLILTMNLFDSDSPYEHIQHRERLSTRLYIISLIIILVFLFVYLLLGEYIRTTTVTNPSSDQLNQLQKTYPTSLYCPCTRTAISYSTFLTLEVVDYHPVCSSSILSADYNLALLNDNLLVVPESTLFARQFLASQLSLLADYCSLSRKIVNDRLTFFLRQQLITAQALTAEQFDEYLNRTINQFLLDMSLLLRHSLDYFLEIIHGNTIMSNHLSNWRFEKSSTPDKTTIRTRPVWYGNCSCASNSQCSLPMTIKNQSFSGLAIGCLPSTVLLQSNLQCLFNRTCLDRFHSVLLDNMTTFSIPNNMNISSQFSMNNSIGFLFNKLFIETWFRQYDYKSYFQICELTTCTYTYTQKLAILYVLTTIIGLFGGLTIVLRLICPFVIKICLLLINFIRKKSITPIQN